MKRPTVVRWSVLAIVTLVFGAAFAQEAPAGLRGEPEAIAAAQAMVETMGGKEIWAGMKSIHFVHEWFFRNRIDSYVENEILDLTGPRSWIEMKSEIYQRVRVYSPEYGYWNVINGEFAAASEQESRDMVRGAPYHIVRIARGIAIDDPFYEVRFGESELRGGPQLEFFGPDGTRESWIALNTRNEPVAWGRPNFTYTFGPMRQYGNLRMPGWAVTGKGAVTYEMRALTGDREPPGLDLFKPPGPE